MQPEPGGPVAFGAREQRLECLRHQPGRHAAAGVGELDHHQGARGVRRAHREAPSARHGLERVGGEFHDRYLQRVRIGERAFQVGGELEIQADLVAHRARDHLLELTEQPVEVEAARLVRLQAADRHHPVGELCRVARRLQGGLHDLWHELAAPPEKLEVSHDDLQEIVQVMRQCRLDLFQLSGHRAGPSYRIRPPTPIRPGSCTQKHGMSGPKIGINVVVLPGGRPCECSV